MSATPTVTVEIAYTYTLREATRSTLAVTREVIPKARLLPWFGGLLVILAIVAALRNQAGFGALIPGGLGAFLLLNPVLVRWTIRRDFARTPAAHTPVRWRISAEQLETRGALGESTFTWDAFLKARETRHGFLLFAHPRVGHWLPLEGFQSASDIAQLRSWIQENDIDFKRG